MAKVPDPLPLLFEQPSCDHLAPQKVILVFIERSVLEAQMRESVIPQFDAAVRPGLQDHDSRLGLSGDMKERFIDEPHYRNLMFIDSRQNLVSHRAQPADVELRAVEG